MPQQGTASKLDVDLFAAFVARVVERLPRDLDPDVTQGWIDNPASLGRVLRGVLAPDTNSTHHFPVWKTLMTGGANAEELAKRLKDGGFYVSDHTKDIMGEPAFVTSPQASEVAFVKVKPKDLGFTKMPTTMQLFDHERLISHNLTLCEPEDGPHIRLTDGDQPRGTCYWIGMDPITGSGGGPGVFDVGRYDYGKRWLDTRYANPEHQWTLENEIVFRSCK